MPAYICHTLIAREVYKKIYNENISKEYLITYSLGGDLCKFSKCRKDSHKVRQDEFILNLIEYIKNNNLEEDSECLGVLYGHICHLMSDNLIHPLVRKVSTLCVPNKNNHRNIELYYDNYLVNKYYHKNLSEYDNKPIFYGKMNKKISDMIDYAYLKTYNCSHVSRYYKFNIWLYKKIRFLYAIFSFSFLKKLLGINDFLINNKKVNFINSNHIISYKLKENKCNYDLDTLYKNSIKESVSYINSIKKML